MTRVYLGNSKREERSALKLFLLDLEMEVIGEAADWSTTLTQVPSSHLDMLLVEWDLLPVEQRTALNELRKACLAALAIVLIGHLDSHQQVALSVGADMYISKGEFPERVAELLRSAAARIPSK